MQANQAKRVEEVKKQSPLLEAAFASDNAPKKLEKLISDLTIADDKMVDAVTSFLETDKVPSGADAAMLATHLHKLKISNEKWQLFVDSITKAKRLSLKRYWQMAHNVSKDEVVQNMLVERLRTPISDNWNKPNAQSYINKAFVKWDQLLPTNVVHDSDREIFCRWLRFAFDVTSTVDNCNLLIPVGSNAAWRVLNRFRAIRTTDEFWQRLSTHLPYKVLNELQTLGSAPVGSLIWCGGSLVNYFIKDIDTSNPVGDIDLWYYDNCASEIEKFTKKQEAWAIHHRVLITVYFDKDLPSSHLPLQFIMHRKRDPRAIVQRYDSAYVRVTYHSGSMHMTPGAMLDWITRTTTTCSRQVTLLKRITKARAKGFAIADANIKEVRETIVATNVKLADIAASSGRTIPPIAVPTDEDIPSQDRDKCFQKYIQEDLDKKRQILEELQPCTQQFLNDINWKGIKPIGFGVTNSEYTDNIAEMVKRRNEAVKEFNSSRHGIDWWNHNAMLKKMKQDRTPKGSDDEAANPVASAPRPVVKVPADNRPKRAAATKRAPVEDDDDDDDDSDSDVSVEVTVTIPGKKPIPTKASARYVPNEPESDEEDVEDDEEEPPRPTLKPRAPIRK
jgi:hypothetical protein